MLSGLLAVVVIVVVGILYWQGRGETPEMFRVGVLPDQSRAVLQQRYQPLLDYLGTEIGAPFQLVVPDDYKDLLSMFRKHEVDIAYFGGLTFLKAHEADDARAIVMRDIDTHFHSAFIARTDGPERTIEEFRGKTLAFGPRLSTSGHLMPRHFMQHESIDPESWFAAIKYADGHDATVFMVRDGEADLGVANAEIVEAMFRDGRLSRDEIRVVEQTPPYANYVLAMRVGIDADLYRKVVLAFLKLSPSDTRHAAILGRLGAGGFLPVPQSEFESLRKIAISLGMLG